MIFGHHDSVIFGHHDSVIFGHHDFMIFGHHDFVIFGHHDSVIFGHHDFVIFVTFVDSATRPARSLWRECGRRLWRKARERGLRRAPSPDPALALLEQRVDLVARPFQCVGGLFIPQHNAIKLR
jgi:hypothetical protein